MYVKQQNDISENVSRVNKENFPNYRVWIKF